MSAIDPQPLARARDVADGLRDALGPYTSRIEIAGSIRRQVSTVNDIEIVAIPLFEERPAVGQIELGGAPPVTRVNLLREAVERLRDAGRVNTLKPAAREMVRDWPIADDGRYWRLLLPRVPVRVDVFLADAETWGMTYMIRTGSAEFARAMLARWKRISGGGESRDARLWRPRAAAPERTPEEIDVFTLCEMSSVPPRLRTSAHVVDGYAHDAAPPRGYGGTP